jgi:hypothetical protein
MPTRQQIESVVEEIERLQAERPGESPWAAMTASEQDGDQDEGT